MTIVVHQRPIQKTRTPSKSCKWLGEAIVNGRTYMATSRMAPANEIARQLVADGVPDAPMQIYSAGLKGCLRWPSFRLAALFTYEETATKQVRMVGWRHNAARMAQYAAASRDKQGVNAPLDGNSLTKPRTPKQLTPAYLRWRRLKLEFPASVRFTRTKLSTVQVIDSTTWRKCCVFPLNGGNRPPSSARRLGKSACRAIRPSGRVRCENICFPPA